jgi:hypothetical protein
MEANKLFLQNYNNQGDCAELHKFAKTIEKEFRKTGQRKSIKYYPWAVIERIFKTQGGKIEVVNWAMKVELHGKDFLPNANGELVLTETTSNALFIHLKGTWQGQEENEYYPIFDNQSAKIIKIPDALDLNTAKQRGMVRLIARLSGIGLEIFEQQEGQFEEDKDEGAINVKQKREIKRADVSVQPATDELFKSFVSGGATTPTPTPTPEPTPAPAPKPTSKPVETPKADASTSFSSDTQEYADLLLEVRQIIRTKNAQTQAKKFVTDNGKELLSQLSYEKLIELREVVNS